MVDALTQSCYPYVQAKLDSGLKSYCRQYRKQQRLLTNANYISRVAICLSRCSRLESVYMTADDPYTSPCYNAISYDKDKTNWWEKGDWMTVYHPEVMQPLDTLIFEYGDKGKKQAHKHFELVTKIIAMSDLQLRELATDEQYGFRSTLDRSSLLSVSSPFLRPDEHLLNLSYLESLHLCPAILDGDFHEQDWSACLLPLLRSVPNLVKLSLRFGVLCPRPYGGNDADEEEAAPPRFEALFDIKFPRLK